MNRLFTLAEDDRDTFSLAALTNTTPHDSHDISITVPTSVAYSLLGKTAVGLAIY